MNTILGRYKFAAMLTALGGVLMGMLMLLFPTVAVKIVCYVLGGCVLLAGLAGLVLFFRSRFLFQPGLMLASAIVAALLGLFILIKAEWVVSFLQVLLAVMVILNGALAIYESFFFKNLHMSYWWTALLYGVLAAAAGIVALCNPFATVLVLTRVLGVMLLLSSAADVLILYRVRKDMEKNQYTRIVIK